MTTIFAIATLGVALFAVCALAIWLTKENEKEEKSSCNKQEKSEDEKDTFYPHMYMDGGGLWGDPFSPFSPYNHL